MTTKRRNWLGRALVLVYWLAAAVAVLVSLNDRGAQSALPSAIGLGAFGLIIVVAGGLLAFALYWNFPLFPDPGTNQKPD